MAAGPLDVLSLADARDELRVEASNDDGTSPFDSRLIATIGDAVSFVEAETGRALTGDDAMDPIPGAIRRAVIMATRFFYNGGDEIPPRAALYALLRPFRLLSRVRA